MPVPHHRHTGGNAGPKLHVDESLEGLVCLQQKVLNIGVTWNIGADWIAHMPIPAGGQIQGTDTIQGDGDLLVYEV